MPDPRQLIADVRARLDMVRPMCGPFVAASAPADLAALCDALERALAVVEAARRGVDFHVSTHETGDCWLCDLRAALDAFDREEQP